MTMPRLVQPLFSKETSEDYNRAAADGVLGNIIRAYDCIWNLHFEPNDISAKDMAFNAEANLNNLGQIIEHVLGESVFDVNPKQLSFPNEILNSNN